MKIWVFLFAVLTGTITGVLIMHEAETLYGSDSTPDPAQLWDTLADAGGFAITPSVGEELLSQRTIFSNTDINARSAREIASRLLLLESRDPGEPITLYLRTEGGWEADAFTIIDIMNHIQSPVTVIGMGDVHSAGIMILAAATGDRRAFRRTILGYHAPTSHQDGLALERYTTFMEFVSDLPEEWLRMRDDEMKYFTPEEAVTYGVIDSILEAQFKK